MLHVIHFDRLIPVTRVHSFQQGALMFHLRLYATGLLYLTVFLLWTTASHAGGAWGQQNSNGSPQIYSQEGRYLGNLNANPYDPNSVSNPYGQYGSPYSPDSINNPYGRYGSPYSPDSANNPYGQGVRVYGR
jgi:hypothetical protein